MHHCVVSQLVSQPVQKLRKGGRKNERMKEQKKMCYVALKTNCPSYQLFNSMMIESYVNIVTVRVQSSKHQAYSENSFHLTENPQRFHYKDQLVNIVQRNIPCLSRKRNKPINTFCGKTSGSLYVKACDTYGQNWA